MNGQQSESQNLTRLGGFEILEKIGEGGMGAVYRARQTSLDRIVALKVLTPRLAGDANYIASFLREAKAAGRLSHPNIVHVYDAGKDGDLYYYAMEFVRGETLSNLVRQRGALSEKTVVEIGLCIAGALKNAWDKEQLIHRDVKPENVMLDADGNVKLCDLGLAKYFGETTTLSLSGQVFGTPQYISPEQARADHAVDFRTDIYSLGLTLYFALTGQVPFHGGAPVLVMARHLTEQLPDPREIVPAVSSDICRVLEKMTAKDVADRYQSWDEVLRDLELVHRGRPPKLPLVFTGLSSVRRQRLMPQPRNAAVPQPSVLAPSRKSQTPLLIAAAAVAVLIIVASSTYWFIQHRGHEQIATQPTEQKPLPSNLADAPRQFAEITKFAELNPDKCDELAARLEQFLTDFPNSTQAEQARQMLAIATAKQMQPAEDEAKRREAKTVRIAEEQRQQEEARRLAEQQAKEEAARAKAVRAFGDFRNPFLEMLARRDYASAEKLAQEAAANPVFEPLRELVAACSSMARELDVLWTSFPATLNKLKGKTFSLQGVTGTLASADSKEVVMEIAAEVTVGIPIAKLTTAEVMELLKERAATPTGDSLLEQAKFCFAEGKVEQAINLLAAAEKLGAATEMMRRLFFELTQAPVEAEAKEAIERLRQQIAQRRWNDARATSHLLHSRYAKTQTVLEATEELRQLDAKIAAESPPRIPNVTLVRTFTGHHGSVTAVALSADGRLALSAGADGVAKVWNVGTGQEIQSFQGHRIAVTAVAFSPDGRLALSGSVDRTVRLWQVSSGKEIRVFHGHNGWVLSALFSPDGRTVLSASNDRTLKLWNVGSGRELRTFQGRPYPLCLDFSPDGRAALSGNADGTVKLWDVNTGQEIRVFRGHSNTVLGVAFTSDGRLAVSASSDGTLKIWEVASGREIKALRGHTGWVTSVAISPEGRYAASGGNDKTIRIWDMMTGRELRVLHGHGSDVRSVVFSRDGQFILSGSADRTLKLWKLSLE